MSASNIEEEPIGLLKATGLQVTEHGIKYFFEPLLKTVRVESLQSIEGKDLLPFYSTLSKGKNYIHFNTKTIHPLVYKENKTEYVIDNLHYRIYGKGDYIAKVVEVLKDDDGGI